MYSVILDMNDVNLKAVESDEEVIRKVEEFANAGLLFFLDQLPKNYFRKNDDGAISSIAIDDKARFVKDLLYLLLDISSPQDE